MTDTLNECKEASLTKTWSIFHGAINTIKGRNGDYTMGLVAGLLAVLKTNGIAVPNARIEIEQLCGSGTPVEDVLEAAGMKTDDPCNPYPAQSSEILDNIDEYCITRDFEEWASRDPKLILSKDGDDEYEDFVTKRYYACFEAAYTKGMWGAARKINNELNDEVVALRQKRESSKELHEIAEIESDFYHARKALKAIAQEKEYNGFGEGRSFSYAATIAQEALSKKEDGM